MKPLNCAKNSGVALVTTVIVIAVLAVVAVAFMQSTSVDRLSSRTVANYFEARLAAESGLSAFLAELSETVERGDFTVLDPALSSGEATRYTTIVQFGADGTASALPFFSSTRTEPIPLNAPYTLDAISQVLEGVGNDKVNLALPFSKYGKIGFPASLGIEPVLPAEFVEFELGKPNHRASFAYVVVDESAKLNVAQFGEASADGVRRNPEISAFATEVPVAGSGPHTISSDQWQSFLGLDPGLRAGPSFNSVFASSDERLDKERFYSSHQGELIDIIPRGYLNDDLDDWTAYQDGGRLKFDINDLATEGADSSQNAFRIADIINENLPDWRLRDISLENSSLLPANPELRYLRRIAAAIVDYIDEDGEITLLEDGEPAGQEPVAYPFKIAERYDWVGAERDVEAGGEIPIWTLTIRHTLFVEMWNPFTVPVSGDLDFAVETLREYGHPTPDDNPINIPTIRATVAVSLQPNEIDVYEVAQEEFTVSIPGEENVATTPIRSETTVSRADAANAERRNHSRYEARWNGQLYSYTPNTIAMFDERGPGLVKSGSNLNLSRAGSSPNWQANVPQNVLTGENYRTVGDPRSHHLSNYPWLNFSYTGDNVRFKGAFAGTGTQSQQFNVTWRKRDIVRAPLPTGTRPSSVAQNPDQVPPTYNQATDGRNAVAYVRNAPMQTIAELGHIHDPASVDDLGANSGTAGTPGSFFGMAGGRTLRIGQPEFPYPTFDVAGQRSYSLLDIFTTGFGKGDLGEKLGGINLNTASEEALTSFFLNLAPVSDEGLSAAGEPPALSQEGARRVAQAIIANRPYFNVSDFYKFMPALGAADNFSPEINTNEFGNLNVMDRGREEVFRRAFNSMETKSGAFKFYGIGRVLSPTGAVMAEAALEAQIELRAVDEGGDQPVLRPVVTQRKFY